MGFQPLFLFKHTLLFCWSWFIVTSLSGIGMIVRSCAWRCQLSCGVGLLLTVCGVFVH